MKIPAGIIFLVFIFWSCQTDSEKSIGEFEGDWEATWELSDPGLKEYYTPDQLKMRGMISFKTDHKVFITAYGFDGCVFSSDTATNELHYNLVDSLINIVNEEEEVIFSYYIDEMSSDRIALSLLNDIHLNLEKK